VANLFQGLLNFLQFVSMSALTALVLVLLPLAILRKARRPISTAIYVISVLWGVTLWVTATAVLLNHWGTIGFVLGVVLLGFGSLPLAAVASALNAEWATAGILLLLVLPVWGARLLAVWLGSSGQDQGRQRTDRRVTEPRARPAAATPKTERMAERPAPQDQDGRSPSPHMEGVVEETLARRSTKRTSRRLSTPRRC